MTVQIFTIVKLSDRVRRKGEMEMEMEVAHRCVDPSECYGLWYQQQAGNGQSKVNGT